MAERRRVEEERESSSRSEFSRVDRSRWSWSIFVRGKMDRVFRGVRLRGVRKVGCGRAVWQWSFGCGRTKPSMPSMPCRGEQGAQTERQTPNARRKTRGLDAGQDGRWRQGADARWERLWEWLDCQMLVADARCQMSSGQQPKEGKKTKQFWQYPRV